jgi:hypothetical protein
MTDTQTTAPGDPATSAPLTSEPASTNRTFVYQFSRQPGAPDTWTADAAYPADSPDSPVPYTLTAEAETLLGEASSPTTPSPITHARDMRAPDLQPASGLSGQPGSYVTEISVPPSDSGIHRLHARMKDPEPEPEAGL